MNTGVGINLFDYVTDKQLGFINFKEGCIEVTTAQGSKVINVNTFVDIPMVYNAVVSAVYELGIKYSGSRLMGDELDAYNKIGNLYMLSDIPNINVMIMLCLLNEYDNYETWEQNSMLKEFRSHISMDTVDDSIHVLYDDTLIYVKEIDSRIVTTKLVLDYFRDMIYYRFTGVFNKHISNKCECKVIEKPDYVSIHDSETRYLHSVIENDRRHIRSDENVLTVYTHNGSYRDYINIFYIENTLYIYSLTDYLKVYVISHKLPKYLKGSDKLATYIWYILSKVSKTKFNNSTEYAVRKFCKTAEYIGSDPKSYTLEQGCKQLLNPARLDNSFDAILERAKIMMGN